MKNSCLSAAGTRCEVITHGVKDAEGLIDRFKDQVEHFRYIDTGIEHVHAHRDIEPPRRVFKPIDESLGTYVREM